MSRSEIIAETNRKLNVKYEPLIKKMIQLEAFKEINHYNIDIKLTLTELNELSNNENYLEIGHITPNGVPLDDTTIAQVNIAKMFKTKDVSFFKVIYLINSKDLNIFLGKIIQRKHLEPGCN